MTHIVCQHHLSDLKPYAWSLVFLVLCSIYLRSSLIHFRNGSEYLTRGTAQVLKPFIRFLLYRLVLRSFLVLISPSASPKFASTTKSLRRTYWYNIYIQILQLSNSTNSSHRCLLKFFSYPFFLKSSSFILEFFTILLFLSDKAIHS